MSFNQVILLGNLTRDIEVRFTPGNKAVGNFGIAVNERWKDASGQPKESVTFVDCEAWGKTAEVMSQYLNKGSPVLVTGRLKLDQWEDKDGGKRSKLKVVVDRFEFVGGGKDKDEQPKRQPQRPKATAPNYTPTMEDSDIPF